MSNPYQVVAGLYTESHSVSCSPRSRMDPSYSPLKLTPSKRRLGIRIDEYG